MKKIFYRLMITMVTALIAFTGCGTIEEPEKITDSDQIPIHDADAIPKPDTLYGVPATDYDADFPDVDPGSDVDPGPDAAPLYGVPQTDYDNPVVDEEPVPEYGVEPVPFDKNEE